MTSVTARLTPAREGGGEQPIVQETLDQAQVRPSVPRVFAHVGCGGWVLWDMRGGFCLECGSGPLGVDEYAKPETGPA